MAPRGKQQEPSRRLLDHLAGDRELGAPLAIFATTFDLTPAFVELDYLPTVLGVSAWDDSSLKGRIELEQQLARLDTVAIAMDGRRYQGRPRSLRIHLTPATLPSSALHAKVSLIVHEDAVRLLVASANLTEAGYRHNREVALSVVATPKRPVEARLIRQALEPMPRRLGPWWNEHAERVWAAADDKLKGWASPAELEDDQFLWSGPGAPLWRGFTGLWPREEPINEIFIVSPFWSAGGADGPVARLLQALTARGANLTATKVKLITQAERDGLATFCPSLPSKLAHFDFRTLGVSVSAAAASPEVEKGDVGRDDVLLERRLHAKALLLIGAKVSLAYVGSANFTSPGWGFGSDNWANVEAGVALLRRGRACEALRGLLPPTCGEVSLDGSAKGIVTASEDVTEGDDRPFPSFLRAVELRPEAQDPARLELAVSLAQGAPSFFSLELGTRTPAQILLRVEKDSSALEHRVRLDSDQVRDLLRQRAVRVHWDHAGPPVDFPLNVTAGARESLPFADPSALPRENELIAYYQGKIAFSDVFPETTEEESTAAGMGAAGSIVETANILSYRIRAFVEALPGIRRELTLSATTPANIRLAFLGPVSPLALANEIIREVAAGRSRTAAAFQLVELLACVRSVKPPEELVERLEQAWYEAVAKTSSEVSRLHDQLKAGSPELSLNGGFARYERAILGPAGGAS